MLPVDAFRFSEELLSVVEDTRGWCERKYLTTEVAQESGLEICSCTTCFKNGLLNKKDYLFAPCCILAEPEKKINGNGTKSITSCATWLDQFNRTGRYGYGHCDLVLDVQKIKGGVTVNGSEQVLFRDFESWRHVFEPEEVKREERKKEAEKKQAELRLKRDEKERAKQDRKASKLKNELAEAFRPTQDTEMPEESNIEKNVEEATLETKDAGWLKRLSLTRWVKKSLKDKFTTGAQHAFVTKSLESIYMLFQRGEDECKGRARDLSINTTLVIGVKNLAAVFNAAGGIVLTYRFNWTNPSNSDKLLQLRKFATKTMASHIDSFIKDVRSAPQSTLDKLYNACEEAKKTAANAQSASNAAVQQMQEMASEHLTVASEHMAVASEHLSKAQQVIVSTLDFLSAEVKTRAWKLIGSKVNLTMETLTNIARSRGIDELRIKTIAGSVQSHGADLGSRLEALLSDFMQYAIDLLQRHVMMFFTRILKQVELWRTQVQPTVKHVQHAGRGLTTIGSDMKQNMNSTIRYIQDTIQRPDKVVEPTQGLIQKIMDKMNEYFNLLVEVITDAVRKGTAYTNFLYNELTGPGTSSGAVDPDVDSTDNHKVDHMPNEAVQDS